MEQERSAGPAPAARARRDAELFIHLRLETAGAAPLLASEDVAQAAQTALASRVRLQRCRVLALGCGADHLHAVLRFPASFPLSHLVQVAWEVSGAAVAHALCVTGAGVVSPEAVWGRAYQLDTLSADDATAVAAYVGRHPDTPSDPRLERADVREDIGRRPAWVLHVREGQVHRRFTADEPGS